MPINWPAAARAHQTNNLHYNCAKPLQLARRLQHPWPNRSSYASSLVAVAISCVSVALAGGIHKVDRIADGVVRVADAAAWWQHCTRLRLWLQRGVDLTRGHLEPLSLLAGPHDLAVWHTIGCSLSAMPTMGVRRVLDA